MRWVGFLVVLGVSGCGAAPAKGPVAKAPASRASSTDELAEVPPAVGRGLWVRVAAPARDFPILAQLLPADEKVLMLLRNPERSLAMLGGEKLAGAADLSRPLEAMTGLGEADEGKFAIAFAARPAARNELALRHVARGRYAVEEPTGRLFGACELWQLPPPTGARIVCGGSAAALRELGPDLVHNTTKRTGAAFRLEIRGKAYRSIVEQSIVEQREEDAALPAAERSGAELGRKWTAALFGGEYVGFDLTLSERSIDVAIDFGYRSVDSALYAAFLNASAAPLALPDAYRALPVDSQVRGAITGVDATTGRRLRQEGVVQLLAALQEDMVISETQLNELEHAFLGVVPESLRGVFALGQDLDAANRLLAAPDKSRFASKELENALAGWSVFGLEAEPESYLRALLEFVKVANYRFPDKVPGTSASASGASMPPTSTQRADSKLMQRAVPKGLPAGSLHLVEEVRPNPAYKPPGPDAPPALRAYDRHAFVVPDGGMVWIVVARTEAVALQRVRQLVAKPAGGAAELAPQRGAFFLGEFSLAAWLARTLEFETPLQRDDARATLKRLEDLPARGRSRIPLSLRVVSQQANGRRGYVIRAAGRFSPEVVTDWFRYAMTAAETRDAKKP